METVSKVCRFCYKSYTTKRKQQRYCGQICAYRGKNKKAFNAYIADKSRFVEQSNHESMRVLRWTPGSETAGLHIDRESYSE